MAAGLRSFPEVGFYAAVVVSFGIKYRPFHRGMIGNLRILEDLS